MGVDLHAHDREDHLSSVGYHAHNHGSHLGVDLHAHHHDPGAGVVTMPGCWPRGGGHFLASHILRHLIMSDVLSDIQSDIDSDILSAKNFDVLFGIDSEIQPETNSILTFYLP